MNIIKELTFEEISINNDKREVRVNGEIIDIRVDQRPQAEQGLDLQL